VFNIKFTRTRRGILALLAVSLIGIGVRANQGEFAGGRWNFREFLAHFLVLVTDYGVLICVLLLGVWFAISGPKRS
jgi:hypothetical protein